MKHLPNFTIFILSVVYGLESSRVLAIAPPNLAEVPSFDSNNLQVDTLAQNAEQLNQQGSLAETIIFWQQVLEKHTAANDVLGQALVWKNIAQIYQRLADWEQANKAISKVIVLLRSQSDIANPSFDNFSHSTVENNREKLIRLLAETLTVQGEIQLARGQLDQALTTWRQIQAIYQKIGSPLEIASNQISQAFTLQALGLHSQANQTLNYAQASLVEQPDTLAKAKALHNLAGVLEKLGYQDRAKAILQQSLTIEEKLSTPELTTTTLQTPSEMELHNQSQTSQENLTDLLEPFSREDSLLGQLYRTQLIQGQEESVSRAFSSLPRVGGENLTAQVVPRAVESIEVNGTKRLRNSYIHSRLANLLDGTLERERLLEALQTLRTDPLIENLSVELLEGSEPNKVILGIQVQEADAFKTELSTDNQGSTSVGTIRRQLQMTHRNLLGFGDRFNLSYVNSKGGDEFNDISYTIPLNRRNGTLGFSYRRSNSNIIEEPLDFLEIESTARQYELTYRQPLLETSREEFALGFTASRRETQTIIGFNNIGPFPLSEGADENGQIKVSALRLFGQYTKRGRRDILALRSQFSLGLDAFGSTINNEDIPDSQFLTWLGQVQYLRLLAPDTIFLLRSDLQLADRPLLSLENFSLGGPTTVRGYRRGAIQGDNGFFASAELRLPILRIPEWQTVLQLTPFFDFGTVWNSSDSRREIEKPTISSVGLGLRLPVGEDFTARIDWGIPLVELESSGDSLQEQGIYFSIEYQPF
ncbi:MAG: ShlB/FhaC/HecB family hemolysin secretion/activation protein [Coleofasciculaceae cyanobacterium]